MSDPIYEDLKKRIKTPEIITGDIKLNPSGSLYRGSLNTRQVLRFTHDEVVEILEHYPIPMPRWMEKFCSDCRINGDKFTMAEDGYGLFEYFSKSKMFIADPEYFRYVKHNDTPFVMNLYNGNEFSIDIPMVRDKIHRIDMDSTPDMILGTNKSGEIRFKYTTFSEVSYCQKNRIPEYMLKFPTLCVNLPYAYYTLQGVPENIYTWDVDSSEYFFGNRSRDDVISMYNDIVENGIQTPLFLRISRGKIVSASDDDYIKLMIASCIGLPTIPAVLYMMLNDIDKDMLVSMRAADIIDSYIMDKEVDAYMWHHANQICNPYFLFHNQKFSSIQDLILHIDGKSYNWTKYVPDYNPSEDMEKVNGCLDYHLKV